LWLKSLSTFLDEAFGRRLLFRYAILGFALCLAVPGSALDPTRVVSQYLHDSWGPERGLPGESITAIAQTSDGYLWIGTDRGLVRFDGLNFRQFERAYPDPMLISAVRALVVDSSDNLWILQQNTQVFRYHNGIFEPIRGWAAGGTTAMTRGTSGAVLLSSSAAGTLTYSENRFRSLSSAALLADAARVANSDAPDEHTTPFSWHDRLASPTSLVVSTAQTYDGKIWLATEDRGLFYLDQGHISSVSNSRPDTKINCFLPLQNSELWIGTANGVLLWNGKELSPAGVPSSLLRLDVLSILRDRDSNIWIGTSRGLFRYNANGLSLVSTYEPSGPVTALFEDREGNIWFGGTRGLERLRDSAFVTYSLPNLKSQSTGPLHVDSRGRAWVAPIQGGLRWLKGEESGAVTADGIANDVVYSIAGIDAGIDGDDIWAGRQRGGLTYLRYSGNSVHAKTYTQQDGLVQNSVFAVYERKDGSVWAGTLSGGVSELKDGHFTNYTTADGLASNTVSAIAEGTDGKMWFATPKGLSEFSKKGWRSYGISDGLKSDDVNCLLPDSAGALWIGTTGGLAFLRDGHIQIPQGTQEWLSEPIFGIAEDRNGWLWIASGTVLLRAKRNSLTSGQALADSDFRVYGWNEGLGGTEGVKRFQSVVKDSEGNVWFSTNHGLSVVNPDRSSDKPLPALLHVEAITVDGSEVNLGQPIRVPAGAQRIAFHYLGLSLANPEQVRYRYWLEGLDSGWSEATSNREAAFANLSPGPYRFRVMSSNSDGVWNHEGTSIDFSVLPTFYQTNWFRAFSATALFALLWCIYQLRVKQLNRQFNIALEARVNERTRIARELHDTLLQSLHGLLMSFQRAANLLPERPVEAKQRLEGAIDQAARAITEGREAVQGLRSSTVVTNDLALAIQTLGEELAAKQTTQNPPFFNVAVEGALHDLNPILRDDVYRIAGEALRNAFHHAQARRIEVDIHYDERQLRLRVRDDGKGIGAQLLSNKGRSGHWGLQGMRERTKLVGGHLEIWSELDSGTEIELRIPASIAYLASAASNRQKARQ
jgi:ligand-binding sensor domain-containing protein/signal transduction histidine kinase